MSFCSRLSKRLLHKSPAVFDPISKKKKMESLLSHLNVDPYLGEKNRLVLVNIMNKQDL